MKNNSSIALEKLRELVELYQKAGKTALPPRPKLVEDFGVSQRAIREALGVLEHEGLITIRDRSGAYIGNHGPVNAKQIPDVVDIERVMEIRMLFEPYMCEIAAENILDENYKRLNKAQSQLLKSNDFDSAELWDGAFHREIAIATRDPLILAIFDQINIVRQSEQWRQVRQSLRDKNYINSNHNEHTNVLKALLIRDSAKAKKAMEVHLGRLLKHLQTKNMEQ